VFFHFPSPNSILVHQCFSPIQTNSWYIILSRPCGLLVSLTYGTNSLITLRAPYHLFLDTVDGYQLLCDAHTLLESHRGTAAYFLFYSLLSFQVLFHFFFLCVCLSDSPISFLGCLFSLLII